MKYLNPIAAIVLYTITRAELLDLLERSGYHPYLYSLGNTIMSGFDFQGKTLGIPNGLPTYGGP